MCVHIYIYTYTRCGWVLQEYAQSIETQTISTGQQNSSASQPASEPASHSCSKPASSQLPSTAQPSPVSYSPHVSPAQATLASQPARPVKARLLPAQPVFAVVTVGIIVHCPQLMCCCTRSVLKGYSEKKVAQSQGATNWPASKPHEPASQQAGLCSPA